MNMPRYYALCKQWQKAPPVYISVAAYLGIYKPDGAEEKQESEGDILKSFE